MSLTLTPHPPTTTTTPSPGAIILLHGGALSSRMFHTFTPHLLCAGYTVYTPDLPGHGSSASLGPFTFARSTSLLTPAIRSIRPTHAKIVLVGVSLGAQAVLDILQQSEGLIDSAVVASTSIRPPDADAQWEIPHMPTSSSWLDLIKEDVQIVGMDNAQGIQQASFNFQFSAPPSLPPVLVVMGENDVAMVKRDFGVLSQAVKEANAESESLVMEGAWHNHPIDVPERFAEVVLRWAGKGDGEGR